MTEEEEKRFIAEERQKIEQEKAAMLQNQVYVYVLLTILCVRNFLRLILFNIILKPEHAQRRKGEAGQGD